MATKKAASTKKATAKKPAAAKTTVRTISAEAKKPVKAEEVVRPTTAPVKTKKKLSLPDNIINIILAELFGTFVLTLVALASFQETGALYVGLALTVLVLTVGVVSGAHVNPAVTFGLWATRKLKSLLVPFYWGAQFLGAILAVIVTNWISNDDIHLDFGHFTQLNWSVFGIELVGAAVFLFGLVAVVSRTDLSNLGRAFGIGTSLLVALVVSSTLLSATKSTAIAEYQRQASAQGSSNTTAPEIPAVAYVKGATLNPAVALAATDSTKSELTTGNKTANESTYSRLTLEVVLGTLVGAALGGNLYLLIAGRNKNN
ncbi:MAG: aquaporin [Candidatus Saccharimonas sp.]